MGKQNHLLLAACSLFAVVHGPGNVVSAAPSPLCPMGIAFKPWPCLLRRRLPNGTAAEQMLAWLKSVFPVNLSAVNFQEELYVLRDVYAAFLSGTVSKLRGSHSDKCDWPPSLGWGLPRCQKGIA